LNSSFIGRVDDLEVSLVLPVFRDINGGKDSNVFDLIMMMVMIIMMMIMMMMIYSPS